MKKKQIDRDALLRDDVGDFSLGRWAVYYGTILSGIVSIVGLALSAYEVILQPMLGDYHSSAGVTILSAGVGIYTSGAISKAWSAQAEAKKMAVGVPSAEGVINDSGSSSEDPTNG